MLIWTYDEWGGWYDHVTPPPAVAPDGVPPSCHPTRRRPVRPVRIPGPRRRRLPFARRGFVSHAVYDHTSVLKTVERKWNLPALTRRDANARDLFDMVDLSAPPAFVDTTEAPCPGQSVPPTGCLTTGPGTIPRRGAVKVGRRPRHPGDHARAPFRPAWWAALLGHAHRVGGRAAGPGGRSCPATCPPDWSSTRAPGQITGTPVPPAAPERPSGERTGRARGGRIGHDRRHLVTA